MDFHDTSYEVLYVEGGAHFGFGFPFQNFIV